MPVCRSSGVPLPNNAQILTNMKMYIQPEIIVSKVEPMMLMQNASILQGPPVTSGDPPAWGD